MKKYTFIKYFVFENWKTIVERTRKMSNLNLQLNESIILQKDAVRYGNEMVELYGIARWSSRKVIFWD